MPEVTWTGDREWNEPTIAKQMLEQAPVMPIAELPENTYGRLRGKALPDRDVGVLIAPVTGRSCFLYLVHIEVINFGHHQHFGERRGAAFVLIQDGHRAVIDPIYARVRIAYEHVAVRAGYFGSTPSEQALLARLNVPREPPGTPAPRFVFQEARIEPGNRVVVCGSGVREADPDARDDGQMYRGEPRTRLHIVGSQRAPIALSTDPELIGE